MFKDSKGNVSMMRVAVFFGLVIGAIMCLGGLGAVYLSLEGASALIQTGGLLMVGNGFAKALQKKFEEKA